MKTEKNDSLSTLFKVTLSNFILFLFLSAIIIIVMSFIFFKFDDPKAYTSAVCLSTLAAACLISGIIQAKRLNEYNSAFTVSFLSVAIVIFMFVLSLFRSSQTNAHDYIKYIIIPIAVAIGCFLGKKRKSSKKHKIRKHK